VRRFTCARVTSASRPLCDLEEHVCEGAAAAQHCFDVAAREAFGTDVGEFGEIA
jgi:hypothetical protein